MCECRKRHCEYGIVWVCSVCSSKNCVLITHASALLSLQCFREMASNAKIGVAVVAPYVMSPIKADKKRSDGTAAPRVVQARMTVLASLLPEHGLASKPGPRSGLIMGGVAPLVMTALNHPDKKVSE